MTTKTMNPKPFISESVISCDNTVATLSTATLVHFPLPDDPTTQQEMLLVEQSGSLDFWASDEENGYSHDDGEPV